MAWTAWTAWTAWDCRKSSVSCHRFLDMSVQSFCLFSYRVIRLNQIDALSLQQDGLEKCRYI